MSESIRFRIQIENTAFFINGEDNVVDAFNKALKQMSEHDDLDLAFDQKMVDDGVTIKIREIFPRVTGWKE